MVEEIINTKYITFNREEWERLKSFRTIEPTPLDDAVTIRRRDIFAGPGLYAYSHAIQTGLDLITLYRQTDSEADAARLTDLIQELEALRDFFAEQAQLAVDAPNKHLPD